MILVSNIVKDYAQNLIYLKFLLLNVIFNLQILYSLINNAIFCFIFFHSLLFADGIKVKGINIRSIHKIKRLAPIQKKIWTKLIHPAQHNAGLCKNTGASLEAVSLCSYAIKSLIQCHFWSFQ